MKQYATRCDSLIDATLSPTEAAELSRRLDGGLPLRDAASFLSEAFDLEISVSAISRWAVKRRRAKAEQSLNAIVQRFSAFHVSPHAPATAAAAAAALDEIKLLLLSDSFQTARRNNDPHSLMQISRMIADIFNASARATAAEARRMAEDTARRKAAFLHAARSWPAPE